MRLLLGSNLAPRFVAKMAVSIFVVCATALLLAPQLRVASPQPPAQLRRPAASRPRAHPPRAGVPGFSTWLRKEFGDAYCGVPDKYAADVLCFDMNSIVHTQLRRSKNESHAFVRIFRQLHATMRVVRPRQHVLLALDGPAPLAKMATQRERRRKSADKSTEKGLSPLYATPGTIFMQRLEEALVYFCCEQLCTQRGSGLTFHVSGAETPGEGEFKLLEWLLAQDPPRGGKRPPSAVIVGGDGDLVLQALQLRGGWDVSVLLELPTKRAAKEGIEPRVSVGALRDSLEEQLLESVGKGGGKGGAKEDGVALALEPVALFALCGNDYLPKVREASFDRLWLGYAALRRTEKFRDARLVRRTAAAAGSVTLDAPFLAALLRVTAACAQRASAAAAAAIEGGATPSEARASSAAVGLDPRSLARLADEAANWRVKPPAEATSVASQRAREYVDGVLWTAQLYCAGGGRGASWAWRHERKFAPSALQIARWLDGAAAAELAPPPRDANGPLPAPLFCSVVLPPHVTRQMAPRDLSRALEPGGALEWLAESHAAEAAAAAAAKEAAIARDAGAADDGADDGDDDEEEEEEGEAAAAPETVALEELIARAAALPDGALPAPLLRRPAALTAQPAWLCVRRLPPGDSDAEPPPARAGLPKLPRLPPRPPTDRMRPLRKGGLTCAWEPAGEALR